MDDQKPLSLLDTLIGAGPLIFMLLIILIGTIALIVVIIKRIIKSNSMVNFTYDSEPLIVKAAVLEKSIVKRDSQNKKANKKNAANTQFIHNVVFKLSGGSKVVLEVSDWEFKMVNEDDEGTLTYLGDKFIEFKKGS